MLSSFATIRVDWRCSLLRLGGHHPPRVHNPLPVWHLTHLESPQHHHRHKIPFLSILLIRGITCRVRRLPTLGLTGSLRSTNSPCSIANMGRFPRACPHLGHHHSNQLFDPYHQPQYLTFWNLCIRHRNHLAVGDLGTEHWNWVCGPQSDHRHHLPIYPRNTHNRYPCPNSSRPRGLLPFEWWDCTVCPSRWPWILARRDWGRQSPLQVAWLPRWANLGPLTPRVSSKVRQGFGQSMVQNLRSYSQIFRLLP